MRARAALWVLLCGACVADDGEPMGMEDGGVPELAEGQPCNTNVATCLNAERLLSCVDGTWTGVPCADYCAGLGPGVTAASTCPTDVEVGDPTNLCGCAPPEGGCEPGEGYCEGEGELVYCTEEWTWAAFDCVDVCADESLASLGCASMGDVAACLCSVVGTPCDGEEPMCADAATLLACVDGQWSEVSCAEECGGEAATCDPSMKGCACP